VNLETWIERNKKLIAVLIAALLLLYVWYNGVFKPASIGYLTATQGLEAEFNSIRWGTENVPPGSWWSNTECPGSIYKRQDGTPAPNSQLSFGYEMTFDPDEADRGMPDLMATQQPFTVDMDTPPKSWSWQVKIGSKTFPNGSIYDVYTQFEMYRYKLSWAVNLVLTGSSWESDGHIYDKAYGSPVYLQCGGAYYNAEIWIKLKPRAFVYFKDNPDQVFFAPAYLGVDEIQFVGTDDKGQKTLDDGDIKKTIDLIPKARGETLGIYYQRGAGDVVNLEDKVLQYQGMQLDPQVFRDEYWCRIILNVFKAVTWTDWGIYYHYKYPSVNIKFFVYVLVVGKWTVYLKTGEVPKLEPHQPITNVNPPWWQGWADWLANPWNQLWIFFVIIVIVILTVTVLNPGVWVAVASMFKRRKE
jgi:hypothetical protein